MQFKQITAIIASCVALSNAVAIPEAAPETGLALDIAAPNDNIMARSLEQKVKHVRKLMARADQAEELADRLQTREAEEAAIQAREEHIETAKLVARDYYDDEETYYRQQNGLHLGIGNGLLDLGLGSDTTYYNRDRSAYIAPNSRFYGRRYRNSCRYGGCW